MTAVITGLVAALAGAAIGTWFRYTRRQRLAARRKVEQPNSHYSPPGVVRIIQRERWHELTAVTDMHPINRDELERLLRQVDAAGADSLPLKSRQFLDNLMKSHLPNG